MKTIFVLSTLFSIASCSDSTQKDSTKTPVKQEADVKITEPDESASQIIIPQDKQKVAEKFKPQNAQIVHSVIQTDIWGIQNAVIVFYETRYVEEDNYQNERQYVDAYLLIPITSNQYEKVLISRFQDDNVDSEIQSVFFANADKDAQKELLILSTCVHRLQYLYDGTEYNTSVFDQIDPGHLPKEMTYLAKISQQLDGGFEGFLDDSPDLKAKFKTAADIKKELKRLGY